MLNFLKLIPLYALISGSLIILSVFSILKYGFVYGIDFTGGTLWELSLPSVSKTSDVEQAFATNNKQIQSITLTGNGNFLLKAQPLSSEDKTLLENSLKKLDPKYSDIRFETQGPTLGRELVQKTVIGALLASVVLLIFIGRSFRDFRFGLAAVLAMFHDVIILTGSFSLFGKLFGAQLDSLFVTALLTTLSASVHDTVVTFDRIRELRQTDYKSSWFDLGNKALSQTIVRSLNNSMTIIFMLVALVMLGAESTRWFGTALLVGAVSGTYSSFAIAVPLVVYLKSRKK